MARKYYQDMEDRRDESRGMKKYEKRKRSGGSFVTGNDPMVGRGDFANMPQEKVMAKYPDSKAMRGGYLDDSMDGIDSINDGSEGRVMRNLSNQK